MGDWRRSARRARALGRGRGGRDAWEASWYTAWSIHVVPDLGYVETMTSVGPGRQASAKSKDSVDGRGSGAPVGQSLSSAHASAETRMRIQKRTCDCGNRAYCLASYGRPIRRTCTLASRTWLG